MKTYNYKYLKTWNSQDNLDILFNKLSDKQQAKLIKLVDRLYTDIESFKDNKDNVYSLILHKLNNKIAFEEKEMTVKKLTAVQLPTDWNQIKETE